jgi:hypothetical protein
MASSLSFVRRRKSEAGMAVRSRITMMMSKSASAFAASSSPAKARWKKATSARASSALQSALSRAMRCQSSRIAIFVIADLQARLSPCGRDR